MLGSLSAKFLAESITVTTPDKTTHAICDENGLELNGHTIKVAIKWLIWQHGLTEDQATKCIIHGGGPTRQRQRQEAIDVADFVEHNVGLST